jgi:Protein of unknown function (DUF3888)
MKRYIFGFIAVLIISSGIGIGVQAETQPKHRHDSEGMEQASDHLYLALFDSRIRNAIADYYKDESIHWQYNWQARDYDVVEVDQTEKGHVLAKPYVVKFTLLTYKDSKALGTDSVSFGVSPGDTLSPNETTQKTQIELLDFQHRKPE